ncbi:MAG: nitroreductase family protein [Candidatus Hodarchaeota archaeon]
MSEKSPVSIDQDKCIQCMECVRTCPTATLYEKNGNILISKLAKTQCIRCAHCMGVCSEDAVTIDRYDKSEKIPVPKFKIDPENLMNFMRSRRSIRLFKPDPIPKSELERLIDAARYAPSGHNDQPSQFTVITGEKVKEIRNTIVKEISIIVNSLPEDPEKMVKILENFVPKNMVNSMISVIDPMKRIFAEMEKGGRDVLFWGAPALIIITAHKRYNVNTMIIENATLAAAYLMLMAEAMDLGTISLGMLMFAIYYSRKVRKLIGLPKDHKARYCLAVGRKDTNFKYLVPRNKPKINFVE